jgi:hypothetical protein
MGESREGNTQYMFSFYNGRGVLPVTKTQNRRISGIELKKSCKYPLKKDSGRTMIRTPDMESQ